MSDNFVPMWEITSTAGVLGESRAWVRHALCEGGPVLPNFLIIGAQKAGTTSLWQYLLTHPQVFLSAKKELRFFVEDRNWQLGQEWYERQFIGAESAVAIGEASPQYTRHPRHPGVAARIKGIIPDVRFLYLLRDPIARIRSEYLNNVVRGEEHEPLEKAVLSQPMYLAGSRYAFQIEQYLEYFSLDHFLVITSEELRDQRDATMSKVFRFLEVGDGWELPTLQQEFNRTENKRMRRPLLRTARRVPVLRGLGRFAPASLKELDRRMKIHRVDPESAAISDDLRDHLANQLRDDIKQLRSYLGNNFDGWGIE
jgi:hypothetical protein